MYFPAKCRESGRMSLPCQLQGLQITECLRILAPNPRWQAGHRRGVWCWMASLWTTQKLLFLRDLSGSWKLPTGFLGWCSRNRGSMGTVEWEREGRSGTCTGSSAKAASGNWGSESRAWSFWGFFIQHSVSQNIFFSISFCFISFAIYLFHFISSFFISFISWNEILRFQLNHFKKWRIFVKELSENNWIERKEVHQN